MSDLSSKSEGYSSFLKNAAVPSTPACCLIIFVIIASYKNLTGIYGIISEFIFFLLFVLTLILVIIRYKNFFHNKKIIFTAAASIAIISILIFNVLNIRIANLISECNLPDYIGNIQVKIDEINLKRYSSEIYFKTEDQKYKSLKGILYYQGDYNFNNGDLIFIHKKIKKISLLNKSPFNFNLISRGIHYSSGLEDNDITIIKKNPPTPLKKLQNNLLKRIDILFDEPSSGLIKALLTGNQNYLEKKIILQFRDSGVLHCLSASGLHVAIFAAIPVFLLLPFIRRNTAMIISLISVLFYLCITDMPVSLVRSVIMYGLFFTQLLLYRERNVFNYLMLTCSIILIISPWELFSPGFQLSFAATAGILIFYRQYRASLNDFPSIIADTTAVTLSAQIITLPIIIFHMNQINTAGIISNIIIIPLISLIMGTALFIIFISFFSISAASVISFITASQFKLSLHITDFIYSLKLNFYIYNITPLLCVFILISLIPLINLKKFRNLKFYPVLISVLLCTLYLKKNFQFNYSSYIINHGNSKAEIKFENEKQVLKLSLEEGVDPDQIITEIKHNNPDIRIIELADTGKSNLIVSKKLLNDYIIDEFRFNGIPDMNNIFKKTIFQLEKDNVIIRFI